MILLVVFFFATEARKIISVKFVCQMIACILHYFMLTTFMWMLVEAVNLYYSFVKIFNGRDKKKFFKWASIASWGMYILWIFAKNYFILGPSGRIENDAFY